MNVKHEGTNYYVKYIDDKQLNTKQNENNKGTGKSSDSKISKGNKVETPKATERRIRAERITEALRYEASSPHEMALQYFIGGGKIASSAIRDLF